MCMHLLPVIIPPVSLGELGIEVDKVACEEQVVLGRHSQGVSHERRRVDGQGGGELAGNAKRGR